MSAVEEQIEQEEVCEFEFVICVDGQPNSRVYGPSHKRNWVLWKVSSYVEALRSEGEVTVNRLHNGEWEYDCNWTKLAH